VSVVCSLWVPRVANYCSKLSLQLFCII